MGFRYLTADEIATIHLLEVGPGVPLLKPDALETAAARPATNVGGTDAFPTLELKAAALFEALIQHHCFQDGNKRTAALAVINFYALNHRILEVPLAVFYPLEMGVVAHRVNLAAVALVFDAYATSIPDPPAD